MCFALIGFFYCISPYLWLILMPMVGSFSGADPVLRLSILFLIQTWFAKLLPRHMLLAEPLVQTGLLVLLLALPMSVTPWLLVEFYSWLLWLAQPVWLLVEVFGVVQLSVRVSQQLLEWMDHRPNIVKTCIMFIATVCYLTMVYFFWTIALSEARGIKACLAPLVVLAAMVHIAVWFSDAGVVSDAAVVSAFSMALLYSMLCEAEHRADWDPPALQDWKGAEAGASFSRLIFNTFTTSLGSLWKTWSFFSKLIHPWFIVGAVVRCYSVMFAVKYLKEWLLSDEDDDNFLFADEDDEDEDEDEMEEDGRSRLTSVVAWRSPLVSRLVVILVYTQLVVQHVRGPLCASPVPLPAFMDVSPARALQIALVNGYYLYYLYTEHTKDDYGL